MAKTAFKLTPDPTFKKDVPIPIPGNKPEKVEFTFKYRDRTQWKEFAEKMNEMGDVELILAMCSGWELADPFDEENVTRLVEKYIQAPTAVLNVYVFENTGARLGNL
jgi:hypothetical protein